MIRRFWLFHYAYLRVPQAAITAGGSWKPVRVPILGALAVHSRRGPVLLDVPYGREGPSNLGAVLGSVLEGVAMTFDENWSVVARLEQFGFRAADVDDVLMTHLHLDHTGGMKTLPHATFHVSAREWEHAAEGTDAQARLRGYIRDDFITLDRRVHRYQRVPHLADHRRGLDVFGDGSVEMFALPGHTPGHCGYRLHLTEGSAVFFAGDVAGSLPQLFGEEAPGVIPRMLLGSGNASEISQRAVRDHLDANPGDIPLVCHDPGLGQRCIDDGPIRWDGA